MFFVGPHLHSQKLWCGGGLQHFSVSPSPLGPNWVLKLLGGLGTGLDNIAFAISFVIFYFFVGSRLLFNIIIFFRASKRLPEFSGLMGKVFPGQLKPRYQIPEPMQEPNHFRRTINIALPMTLRINVKSFKKSSE